MATPQYGSSTAQFPFVLGEPDANTITRSVTQTMLSQDAQVASVFRLAADRLFWFGAFPGPGGGPTGEIGQEATNNYVQEVVNNQFFAGADANITGYDYEDDIIQYLGFTDRFFAPDLVNSLFSNPGNNNFVTIGVNASAENTFSWIDHGFPRVLFPPFPVLAAVRAYRADDTMLSETVTFGQVEDVSNIFDLDSLIDSGTTDFGRDPSQSVIKQHVAISITGPGTTCPIEKTYSPLKGSSDDTSFPDIPATPPTLGQATLTLTYPRVTPTTTLEMKNPEFGNRDTITFAKIDRETRGGTRVIYSDPKWGEWQTFELRLERVCGVAIDQLIDFLNESLAKEIGLLDWEARQWKGVIVAPNTQMVPTNVKGPNGQEAYTVSLIFEGELV